MAPPPKAPNRGGPRGGPGRGRGRGGAHGPGGSPPSAPQSVSAVPAHISTIGVRRPGYGQVASRRLEVFTNHYETTIPEKTIYHYDVVILPERPMPIKANFEIIMAVQAKYPNVFNPRVVYDGRKNAFAPRVLTNPDPALGPDDPLSFFVMHSDLDPTPAPQGGAEPKKGKRAPKRYDVRFTKVATINPEVLRRFLQGTQSSDNTVLTAIMALNIVIRMAPSLRHPFNVRSFFTDQETKPIGRGIILWRGYFQSVRPAIGRMLINVDISTGMMFKDGPLANLLLEILGRPPNPGNYNALSPGQGQGRLPDRERIRLQKSVENVKFLTTYTTNRTPRGIKKLSAKSARDHRFQLDTGRTVSVAQYFQETHNIRLQYPDMLCVELPSGAMIPVELCVVPKGQIMKKQVPPDLTSSVLDFATKRPEERLASINNGFSALQYGDSEYLRQFGMAVTERKPCLVQARVLAPAVLKYGQGSRQQTIQPRDGAWNMIDRKFWKGSNVTGWMILIYETQHRFRDQAIGDMIQGLRIAGQRYGIFGFESEPLVSYQNAQGNVISQLRNQGGEFRKKTGNLPNLVVVVLPDASADIYRSVKHFGDIQTGVSTQCLKSSKCARAKDQYWANVALKINVKLGGVNCIPDTRSVPFLTDPANPTIVMGADVAHPAPGPGGRPSFSSVVGNVDSDTSKYIATTRIQRGRVEMIQDLEEMSQHVVKLYHTFRNLVEKKQGTAKRIIFFRDGVSEGQFQQCLEQEVPQIKKACQNLKLNPMPKLTFIVVGKRHHVRFFPKDRNQGDRSGNCPAGLVVDNDITHPTEFDFYLQSHGGLLGTSRPCHYNILYDENGLSADNVQSLAFALTHVYARATRSVSLPAPVYYAHIVCDRAKTHFDPSTELDFSDTVTMASGTQGSAQQDAQFNAYRAQFRALHANSEKSMYFM